MSYNPQNPNGQAPMSASTPVVVASNQSSISVDASEGELIEALEALRMAVVSLTRSNGLMTVDTTGRIRILLDAITANLTLATVTSVGTVSTVTTVSTLTNQSQIGTFAAQDQIPALMSMNAQGLRANINVT
jgi:hypothetical protein